MTTAYTPKPIDTRRWLKKDQNVVVEMFTVSALPMPKVFKDPSDPKSPRLIHWYVSRLLLSFEFPSLTRFWSCAGVLEVPTSSLIWIDQPRLTPVGGRGQTLLLKFSECAGFGVPRDCLKLNSSAE